MNRQLLVAAAGLLAMACYVPSPKTGKSEKFEQSWPRAEAESLEVSVSLGVGTLRVSGGAEAAAEVEVEYNIPDWKPVASWDAADKLGRLELTQPSSVVGATWPGNVRYDWNLKLADSLPTRLDVEFGVGKAELDLRNVDVRRLEVDAGVGEGRIDVSGPRRAGLDIDVEAGIGKLTLVLPASLPVEVDVEGGIGDVEAPKFSRRDSKYVNEAANGPRITVNIEAGVGKIELVLAPDGSGSI